MSRTGKFQQNLIEFMGLNLNLSKTFEFSSRSTIEPALHYESSRFFIVLSVCWGWQETSRDGEDMQPIVIFSVLPLYDTNKTFAQLIAR